MAQYIKKVKYNNGQDVAEGNILINGSYANGITFNNKPLGTVQINGNTYTRMNSSVPSITVSTSQNNAAFTGDAGDSITKTYPISGGFGQGSYSVGDIDSPAHPSSVSIDASIIESGNDSSIKITVNCSGSSTVSDSGLNINIESIGYGVNSSGASGQLTKTYPFEISYSFIGAAQPATTGFEYDGIAILYSNSAGTSGLRRDYPPGNGATTTDVDFYDSLNTMLINDGEYPTYLKFVAATGTGTNGVVNALLPFVNGEYMSDVTRPLIIFEGDLRSYSTDDQYSFPESFAISMYELKNESDSLSGDVEDTFNWLNTNYNGAIFLILGESLPSLSSQATLAMEEMNIRVVQIDTTVKIAALNALLAMNGDITQMPDGSNPVYRIPGTMELVTTSSDQTVLNTSTSNYMYALSGIEDTANMVTTVEYNKWVYNSYIKSRYSENGICNTTAVEEDNYPIVFMRGLGCMNYGELVDYFSNIKMSCSPAKQFRWSSSSTNFDTTTYQPHEIADGTITQLSDVNNFVMTLKSGDLSDVYEAGRYAIVDVTPTLVELLENGGGAIEDILPPGNKTEGLILIDSYGTGRIQYLMGSSGESSSGITRTKVGVFGIGIASSEAADTVFGVIQAMVGAGEYSDRQNVPFAGLLYAKNLTYGNINASYVDDTWACNYFKYVMCTAEGSDCPSQNVGFIPDATEDTQRLQTWYLPSYLFGMEQGAYSLCPYYLSDKRLLTDIEGNEEGFNGEHGNHIALDIDADAQQ